MVYVLGGVVAVFLALVVIGAVTGRVEVRSCCTVADPRRDARMRAAFEDDVPPVESISPAPQAAAPGMSQSIEPRSEPTVG